MRDLKADLELCNKASAGPWYQEANYWDEKNTVLGHGVYQYFSPAKLLADMIDKEEDAEFIADARKGWPHAIERAINAEAEVERLVKINQGCEQEAHIQDDILRRYKAENAKLKEIIKRMRLDFCRLEYGDDFDSCSTQEREGCGSCAYLNNFETAYLAELDKDEEGER